jgi:hypothetical protein
MKIEMKRNRSLINIIRLVVGVTGTVQGFLVNEFALSLAGFLLVYMAVAYFDSNRFGVELKKVKATVKETGYEKVDARL